MVSRCERSQGVSVHPCHLGANGNTADARKRGCALSYLSDNRLSVERERPVRYLRLTSGHRHQTVTKL